MSQTGEVARSEPAHGLRDLIHRPSWLSALEHAFETTPMRIEEGVDGDQFVVRAELPGIEPENDVEINVRHVRPGRLASGRCQSRRHQGDIPRRHPRGPHSARPRPGGSNASAGDTNLSRGTGQSTYFPSLRGQEMSEAFTPDELGTTPTIEVTVYRDGVVVHRQ